MDDLDLQFFVGLELRVWDALADGDAAADHELLSSDFVGVYPTGFAGKADHAAQLADGPTVASYAITEARFMKVSPDAIMLSYCAEYRRPDRSEPEAMYVSSLWQQRDGRWWNTFSQDSPVGAATV
ncbi:DUF4440 domain-containing protein [Microbacterium invictum]|uniref:DUF4440 domain-containing protein n=1 Tax=Microbacterium invictum TaxID=515415 RepID=A0AA40SPH9_9MICO|nr:MULTISPECIES: DUF4440 domain-containing protein [Microbacterium]MBB4139929.1 hypothetical protein [Microbacterium invictum]